MLKQFIKSRFSDTGLLNNYFSGIATIFMLHRVYPFENNKLFPNENIKISPEFLDNFIIKLKNNGYEFISLDRLYEILKRKEYVKKQIIFTLDDGYLDNYTHAYPIFKKHHVPFTIYVTSSFPDKNAILWWYLLEELIVENNTIELPTMKFECKTVQEKIRTFMQIREHIIGLKTEYFFEELKGIFTNYDIDWYKPCNEIAMTWKEITELSTDNLVTIGGHTVNHLVLNRLSKKNTINEIINAHGILEKKINKKVSHFAYPFGSINEIGIREFKILKELDIKTATTTRHGNIYHQHINYLEALPRIMLTEHFELAHIGKIRRKRVVVL